MAVPGVQDITLPLLKLSSDGREWTMPDAVNALSETFQLSDDEREDLLPSGGQTRMYNRTIWAAIRLQRAGLLRRPSRGHYSITDTGRELLKSPPERITDTYLKNHYPGFAAFKNGSAGTEGSEKGDDGDESTTPEERIEAGHKEIEEALAADLLERLTTWSESSGQRGRLFERLVVDLLLAMGYGKSLPERGEIRGGSGDGGIDGVISEDNLGLDKIYVQAKCWKNPVPIKTVREFVGSVASTGVSKGILITTSTFTGDPRHALGPIPQRLEFIDGQNLARLMIKHGVGVKEVKRYTVKRVDTDYFEPEDGVSS